MTRYLSRALSGLESNGVNGETDRLFAYHHATKHTYLSVRANAHYLDWQNQPNPFRTYEGAPLVALPPAPDFSNAGAFATMAALAGAGKLAFENDSISGEQAHHEALTRDINLISRLLWHSMAVSAWKKVGNTANRYSLRVNPSSGNLHPTETHLALTSFVGLDDGLYHFRPDRHALEFRSPGAWTQRLAAALEITSASESLYSPADEFPLIIALTSIFWREAWKYRNRAYRYCCHDLGHAMMSLLMSARALGLRGGAIAHFCDSRLSRELGLEKSDEAPMAFLVFPAPRTRAEQTSPPTQAPAGDPNILSAEEIDYELLLGMHRSTILTDPVGPAPANQAPHMSFVGPTSITNPSPLNPIHDAPLAPTVRQRRSALDFDPRSSLMPRDDLHQLLDFATRDWLADWRGNFNATFAPPDRGADFVALYLYIHRVQDCAPGVYRWNNSVRKLDQLHRGNVERVAAFLSLEQPLAGNSCFTVSMIADLAGAARAFGNRGYRYVHFEAGAIGQRLYVGAEALGWRATGIGAFYDDDVHRYLGFLEEGDSSHEGTLDTTMRAAEQSALVTLGSPASRLAAVQAPVTRESAPMISESREEHLPGSEGNSGVPLNNESETTPQHDPRTLPRQVIYHFAVGRAVPDPRLEA
ncbi:MAG: SagB/ThcOx family dehydrogenase [Candidatus Acidiferrales bacterium]